MGNGCLKPTPRTGEIYIDCINKIYQEVQTVQYNQEKKPNDMYISIKQLLQKKGWLRKLMDNLTSHRQSISQAALHNFRLMTQSKGIQSKVTGLVVIDYIITGVHRESGLQMNDRFGQIVIRMIRDKEGNTVSEYQERSQKNNVVNGMKKRQLKKGDGKLSKSLKYLQQQQVGSNDGSNSLNYQQNSLISNLLPLSTPPVSNSTITTNTLLFRQIYNVKFSNIFYNMLHSLISTEDSIYSSAINSIISYTRYHTVKNIQQEKITQLMQILLEHIQTGEEINRSLKAYEMLLKKLRQTFLQNQIKHFKVFLKIWQHSFQQTHNQQIDNIHIHLQNKLLLESIIHQMIVSMIGSVGINKIYEQIILVYDQHKFQGMQYFEQMMINITKKDQLKKQFYRGLYSFLLSYLAVCKSEEQQQGVKSMIIGSTRQLSSVTTGNNPTNISLQKWPCIHSSKSYQSFISQYQNIGYQRVKRQVIQTLKRWNRQYQFVQINEIIKYNSQLVLNSFLFNIHECFVLVNDVGVNSNDSVSVSRKKLPPIITTSSTTMSPTNSNPKPSTSPPQPTSSSNTLLQFANDLSQQFCSNFCYHANLQQRISLVNLLYDEVKSGYDISDNQKVLYLDMVENLLYDQQLQQSSKTIDWCQADVMYNNNINIKLITVVVDIVARSTQKMLTKQLDHLAYFMHSLFDLFTKTNSSHYSIVQTLNQSIKLIQTIEKANGPMIILSFTERMVKAMTNQMNKVNFYYTWDFILNCVHTLLMSPRNFNRQQTQNHLHYVYSHLTVNEKLKINAVKLTTQEIEQRIDNILVGTFGNVEESQIQGQFIKIHLPKPEDFENHHHLTGSHEKIYQLSSIAFRDMFSRGVSRAKGGFLKPLQEQPSFMELNGGNFSRVHSIIHEDELRNEQRSIADVMDMIHY